MTAFRVETMGGLTVALTAIRKACEAIWINDGVPVIEVKEDCRGRTAIQNAKIHAMLSDIAEQVDLRGNKYSAHVWKRLTVSEWLKEKGERPLLIQDLSGEIMILWEKTSAMSTKQMAEYTDWLYAFGTTEGVKWTEPKDKRA